MSKALISFRKVLLSSGKPTIEAVVTFDGIEFFESASEGKTLGLNETQNNGCYYNGDFSFELDEFDQKSFDKKIVNKSSSQVSTALSCASMRAYAYKKGYTSQKLFKYFSDTYGNSGNLTNVISNILNGSKHAANKLSFCEFMIIPQGSTTYENIKIISQVYLDLGRIIEYELGKSNLYIGREGGFAPQLYSNESAVILIEKAINTRNKGKCKIAIDVAANSFSSKKGGIFIYNVDGKDISTNMFIEYYRKLLEKHPNIIYLEDPFHEEDIEGWKNLYSLMGENISIVADDLTITKSNNIEQYQGMFNACILKLNQAGSLSELIKCYNICNKYGIKTIISQRSGETDSNLISHIAFGLGANYLKAGAPARERIIKYNELLRISSK